MSSDRVARWGVAAALALLIGTAAAQYTHDPFFDDMQVVSHAFGFEMALLRLHAMETLSPVPVGYMGQVEKLLGRDVRRFRGSLAARDGDLAAELVRVLEELEDAAAAGEDVTGLVAEARELLEQAYDAVVDPEARSQPHFIGVILADLLLADDGVAEAYEDAAEDDLWEYPNGWAALQRVEVLWAEIEDLASPARQEDVREMLDFLHALYPNAHPPDEIRGDPEEPEAPTQRIVGILEEVVDASLYTGRDLPALAGHLADVLVPSCEAYAAGDALLGVEGVYTVRNHYRKQLRRLLDLIDPDVHERATELLDGLISRDPPQPQDDACRQLVETLREARASLGG